MKKYKRLICYIFGHKYFIIQKFGHTNRKIGCERCHDKWGMNDRVKAFIPWSGELDELYISQGYRLK